MKPDLKPAQPKLEYLDATVYQETDGAGLPISIKSLTARFFYCAVALPQRNNYGKMNLAIREKNKMAGLERQKRTSKQHERSQARAGGDSEAPRGERHDPSTTSDSKLWTAS